LKLLLRFYIDPFISIAHLFYIACIMEYDSYHVFYILFEGIFH
jgi:hypothetical protein